MASAQVYHYYSIADEAERQREIRGNPVLTGIEACATIVIPQLPMLVI
jgi:hypothetical protein